MHQSGPSPAPLSITGRRLTAAFEPAEMSSMNENKTQSVTLGVKDFFTNHQNLTSAIYQNFTSAVYQNLTTATYQKLTSAVYQNRTSATYQNLTSATYQNLTSAVYQNLTSAVYQNITSAIYQNLTSPTYQNLTPTSTPHVYENIVPVTLLFVFGVVGNAIALSVLICSAKTHKWRPFYRLVCGLAISDGGGILASYPFAEYRYLSNFEYDFPEALCNYLGFVFMFTLMSSAMVVCCMSVDRFVAIFYPFVYNTPTKERRAMMMLGAVWVLAGILSSLHLYGLGASRNYYPGSWCFLDFIDLSSTSKVIYSYIYAFAGAIVVTLTVIINLMVIVFFVKNKFSQSAAKSNRNDLPVVLFLLMIVTLFTSCWAPLMVRDGTEINPCTTDTKWLLSAVFICKVCICGL